MVNTYGFYVGATRVLWEAKHMASVPPLVAAHVWPMGGTHVGHSWGPWNFAIWANFECEIGNLNEQIITDSMDMKHISVKYDQSLIRWFSNYIQLDVMNKSYLN